MSVTRDAFLGGRLQITQPARGYRAGVDPVLLAAAVPARAGQSVLELGCGVGTAMLCLAARVPGVVLTGVEMQPDYADLARQNMAANGATGAVLAADLRDLPPELRNQSFDHVIANPPYFMSDEGCTAADGGRDLGRREIAPLADWIDVATRRLAPRGMLTMIQRAERLGDILSAIDSRLGSVIVQPLAPRTGRAAHLVIVQARKGGRAPLGLRAPVILHEGSEHTTDAESYTTHIRAILRDGAALPLCD